MKALLFPLLLAGPVEDVTERSATLLSRDMAKAADSFTADAVITFVVHDADRKRMPDEVYVGPERVRDFLEGRGAKVSKG